jgi:ubiquinone/menaquinone biosynthesis C-methylase UbiE
MMGLYSRYLLPRLIDLACAGKPTFKQREKVVPRARGRVLEVGIGSGHNLPLYDGGQVEHVTGVDPSPELWKLAEERARDLDFGVEFVEAGAEEMPLATDSFDTAMITYTLCSIPDAAAALSEVRRVLRPGGELVFCEHGLSPDPGVSRWQNRLQPLWGKLSGGCHINREIPAMIEAGGFEIRDLETMYIPGVKVLSYNFWGAAV